jgi:predicted RNA-binding Zn-ribbon protein involved in translation (DUF1610 family)
MFVSIKCPNCGSVATKGIKPEEYICNSCGGKSFY